MSQPLICILLGFAISLAVSAIKGIPFVQQNPKIVAAILSTITALVANLHLGGGGIFSAFNPLDLLVCFVQQLSAAIGTHEVLVKPVAAIVAKAKGSPPPPPSVGSISSRSSTPLQP